jgi:serine/threonine protein kinase
LALPLLNRDVATSDMEEPFKTLGRFRLVELIGRGGMGEVFLGVDPNGMERRAIKVLLPDVANNPSIVASFRREAEIGKQLSLNPSIVAVHGLHEALVGDLVCPERVLFLVLDFVDGVNLRRLAERYHRAHGRRLPTPIVVHIVRAMLRALDAAHTHSVGDNPLPVVHGDVNPGNVLISSRGEVRMTDFGISRFAPEPVFISRPVGTLPYMAPEQYLGRICPQNDLYAVGVVLHELLTGAPPMPCKGSRAAIERQLLEDPVPLLGRADVPEALDRLRRGLLEKDASLRIQTAAEALASLVAVDQSDRQDEIKVIYRRMFGPPRSRMTRYLQAKGDSSGSFVMELLSRHGRAATAEVPRPDSGGDVARPRSGPEPASSSDDDDGGMPWLTGDDDEESSTTQVHHRSAQRLSSTVRLDLPVGTRPPFSVVSTPTVPEEPPVDTAPTVSSATEEPTGEGSDVHAVTTMPRNAAAEGKEPPLDPRRYPPRPPHLADGVPFQLRRPTREATKAYPPSDAEPVAAKAGPPSAASEPEPAKRREETKAGKSTDSGTGPHQTQPQRSPATQPDALPPVRVAKPSRPPKGSSVRWVRSAFVTVAAVLLVACGIGLVALALGEPEAAIASPNNPHPATMAATGSTTGG